MLRIRLVVAAALLATLSACGSSGKESASSAESLTIATAIDLNSFDPADGIDGHFPQYLQPVYDSLVRIDPEGKLQPMLATEWSYDDARTTLSLTIREGVKFSDGAVLDAEGVKANLLNVKNGKGTLSTALLGVEDIEVASPTKVTLKLAAPDPTLLRNLGQPPGMMASPKALGTPQLKTTPVGSGPYLFDAKNTTKGSKYTFTRNEKYWDKDNKAIPTYKTIILKPIVDTTARLNALRSGQADAAMGDPSVAAEAKSAGLRVTTWSTGDLGALYIFDRDGKSVPALKDVRVRQAINYAIDPDALVKQILKGYGTPTRQAFNLDSNGYEKSLEGRYSFDPAKAKQLLAEAGYADGFELPMPELPITAQLGAVVGQQLKDVGITVKWQKVAMSNAIAEVSSGKFPAILMFFQSGDPWQALNYYIAPNAPWNPLHTSDPEVSDLIAKAQGQTGTEQGETYKALNSYVVENAWFAPWASPQQVYMTTKDVSVAPQAFAPIPSIYNYRPSGS